LKASALVEQSKDPLSFFIHAQFLSGIQGFFNQAADQDYQYNLIYILPQQFLATILAQSPTFRRSISGRQWRNHLKKETGGAD
jgi:hypothetical protein